MLPRGCSSVGQSMRLIHAVSQVRVLASLPYQDAVMEDSMTSVTIAKHP